jgi:ABC-type bacteriocin/lantibiotic exporter with double-glycine peptidase domain
MRTSDPLHLLVGNDKDALVTRGMTTDHTSDPATRFVQPEWRWLWKEVRPFIGYQIGALLFTMSASAMLLVSPLMMKWLIDAVLPAHRWGALAAAAGIIAVTSAMRTVLNSASDYIKTIGVERVVFRLRLRLFRRLQGLPATFFARQPIGEIVQRIERDVGLVGDLGSEAATAAIRIILETLMTAGALIVLDWRLSAIVGPLVPLVAYVRYRSRSHLQRGAEQLRAAAGRQSSHLNEALAGAVQVQLLGAERRFARRYASLSMTTMALLLNQRRMELLFAMLSMSVISLGVGLIVWYGGMRVMTGSLTAGGLIAFYSYVGNIFSPLSIAVDLSTRLNRVRASIRRLIDIETTPDSLADVPGAAPLVGAPKRLRLDEVSFDYDAEAPALRRVNADLHAGERIAFVGQSGCGKTSLLKLVPRVYDVSDGAVMLGGRDIRSIPLRQVRRAISFVPQDAILFRGTLLDNVRHANPLATTHEIAAAAEATGLAVIVDRLPAGWNTELGPLGIGLSGGERQRLAITRALVQQRPILILDEATSALEPAAEDRLLTRLTPWCANRIVIVVSHRLAVARWADRIVVLQRGEIVEAGSHEALYRPGTHYHALWQRAEVRQEMVDTTASS